VIELPEAAVLAAQINKTLVGKKIKNVVAAHTPHKLAWYFGDPQEYKGLLAGNVLTGATSYGGQVEISAGKAKLVKLDNPKEVYGLLSAQAYQEFIASEESQS